MPNRAERRRKEQRIPGFTPVYKGGIQGLKSLMPLTITIPLKQLRRSKRVNAELLAKEKVNAQV